MRLLRRGLAAGISLSLTAALGAAQTADEAAGKQWWAHVQFLADPSMKGRQTGSEEYLKSAA